MFHQLCWTFLLFWTFGLATALPLLSEQAIREVDVTSSFPSVRDGVAQASITAPPIQATMTATISSVSPTSTMVSLTDGTSTDDSSNQGYNRIARIAVTTAVVLCFVGLTVSATWKSMKRPKAPAKKANSLAGRSPREVLSHQGSLRSRVPHWNQRRASDVELNILASGPRKSVRSHKRVSFANQGNVQDVDSGFNAAVVLRQPPAAVTSKRLSGASTLIGSDEDSKRMSGFSDFSVASRQWPASRPTSSCSARQSRPPSAPRTRIDVTAVRSSVPPSPAPKSSSRPSGGSKLEGRDALDGGRSSGVTSMRRRSGTIDTLSPLRNVAAGPHRPSIASAPVKEERSVDVKDWACSVPLGTVDGVETTSIETDDGNEVVWQGNDAGLESYRPSIETVRLSRAQSLQCRPMNRTIEGEGAAFQLARALRQIPESLHQPSLQSLRSLASSTVSKARTWSTDTSHTFTSTMCKAFGRDSEMAVKATEAGEIDMEQESMAPVMESEKAQEQSRPDRIFNVNFDEIQEYVAGDRSLAGLEAFLEGDSTWSSSSGDASLQRSASTTSTRARIANQPATFSVPPLVVRKGKVSKGKAPQRGQQGCEDSGDGLTGRPQGPSVSSRIRAQRKSKGFEEYGSMVAHHKRHIIEE